MKAIIWTNYGPPEVLQLQEYPKPVPGDKEILVKIHATTITAGDCEVRRFAMPRWIWLPMRLYMGVFKPRIKILGQELAGEIAEVGKEVTNFKKGDAVLAPTTMKFGAYAEYVCLPAGYIIAIKPVNMSYEEAATLPAGGLNALHFFRKANMQPGQRLLVNGAGGSIGTYIIQLAKLGGIEITAVDSAAKSGMLRSIGADHVIDYTKEDFSNSITKYDAIIDIVGKRSFARCIKALKPGGTLIMGNPRISGIIRGLWVSVTSGKKAISAMAGYKVKDLNYLTELIAAGKLTSIIDKIYPLQDIVAAHAYVEKGLKKGNVVVKVL